MDHTTSDRAARLALVAAKTLPVIAIFLGALLLVGVYARFAPVCRLVSSLTDQPIWLEQSVFDFGHSFDGTGYYGDCDFSELRRPSSGNHRCRSGMQLYRG